MDVSTRSTNWTPREIKEGYEVRRRRGPEEGLERSREEAGMDQIHSMNV